MCDHPLERIYRCDRCGAVVCQCGYGHNKELTERYGHLDSLVEMDIYETARKFREENSQNFSKRV